MSFDEFYLNQKITKYNLQLKTLWILLINKNNREKKNSNYFNDSSCKAHSLNHNEFSSINHVFIRI
jgi:hypothetical protein